VNRRQIIHWCQGQHAAAYFLEKRRGRVSERLNYEQLVNEAFEVSDSQLERFRLGLFYENGKMMYYPNRMTFKKVFDESPQGLGCWKKTDNNNELISFKTGSIDWKDLTGLAHVAMFNHEGLLIQKLYISKKTMNDFTGISAPILFNLRKKGTDERLIEGKD
jgi:hypothetical protein